jgi:hypothetical protein
MSGPFHLPVEISFTISVDPRKGTLHDLQRDMRRESRRVLRGALSSAIGEVERALLASPVVCPVCQGSMRSRGRNARRIVTVFGTLEIDRARYGCKRCGTVRRPLDEWFGLLAGTECTAAVREQALFLAADLPFDRAADALRHLGGIGLSGRQIQRLLHAESPEIEAALGTTKRKRRRKSESGLDRRFRRAGKNSKSAGVERVLQLRQLKTSGLWNEYWARRFGPERASAARTPNPPRAHRRAEPSR